MKKVVLLIAAALLCMMLLTSCAPGPSDRIDTPDSGGDVAGFWLGLWHGTIALITFIISLFSDHVSIYEVHNNGGWYNLGFLLGIGGVLGGGIELLD